MLVESDACGVRFGAEQGRQEGFGNEVIVVVVENGVNAIGSVFPVEVAYDDIVDEVAASTLQPCLDADVCLFAAIVN